MCTSTAGAGRPPGALLPTTDSRASGSAPRAPELPTPDLPRLRLTELRVLRRDALRTEADLSYVRRLVQGRIDILRAELELRLADRPVSTAAPVATMAPPPAPSGPAPPVNDLGGGAPTAPLVARLSRILADRPAGQRSSARHVTLGTPHSEEYGRLAAAMLAEVELSDLDARTDDELLAAMGRLVAYEQQVSRRRQQLQHIADGCGAEIARRYREGEAQVDDLLA